MWNAEYPARLRLQDDAAFDQYLDRLEDAHSILLSHQDMIYGWLIHFTRDGERWFAMILDSRMHGKGYGSKMLAAAKRKNEQLHGWVIDHDREWRENGLPYKSPLAFYLKNGFSIVPGVRIEKEYISGGKIRWSV